MKTFMNDVFETELHNKAAPLLLDELIFFFCTDVEKSILKRDVVHTWIKR